VISEMELQTSGGTTMKKVALIIGLAILAVTAWAEVKNPVVTAKQETISGTLTIVSKDEGLIFVKSSEGITYDFKISGTTKIVAGGRKLMFDQLAPEVGKQVEVTFVPLKTAGNKALTVELK